MSSPISSSPTSTRPPRERKWDFLRGVAIFLVVLGHVIQWMDVDWKHNALFIGIYSFHMPLFMFVSGYFLRNNLRKMPLQKWTLQKLRQLLLPSFTNSLIYSSLLLLTISLGFSNRPPKWDHEALWYLNTLCIFVLSARFIAPFPFRLLRIALWMVGYYLAFFWQEYPLSMYLKFMLPFFLLGHLYRKIQILSRTYRIALLAIGCLSWCFSLPLWDFAHSIYMLPYAPLNPSNIRHFLILYANGIGGIATTLLLMEMTSFLKMRCKISDCDRTHWGSNIVNIIVWLGTITLPIYIVQTQFFVIREVISGFSSNPLLHWAATIALLPLCYGVYWIVTQNRWLKFLLFGERKSTRSATP